MHRTLYAVHGRLEDALTPIDFPANPLPINWLPEDGAWFVGNDIYARSVFVGGSVAAVSSVLQEPGLEAYVVSRNYSLAPED
jgi:hypothetical protein